MPRHASPPVVVVLALLSLLVTGACTASSIPVVSFDPASSCTSDGRMPGAYPDLEALLPSEYDTKPPTSVDSGRNCTADALGTLTASGIKALRFAGATWDLGGTTAVTVAVFKADGLTPASMIQFYAAGARSNSKTEKAQLSDTTVAGEPASRLDVLQTDGTGQTVVAWPSDEPGLVHVLLASDLGDTKVLAALDEFGSR